MLVFILRRLFTIVPTLIAMTLIVFVIMQAIPGSPFDPAAYGGNDIDPAALAAIEARYGLDKPLHEQYLNFVGRALRGDFGESFAQRGRTVNEILAETFPVSFHLGIMAFLLALGLGVPLGIIAAARRNSAIDYGVTLITLLGISLPNFVIGILLILIFSLLFGLLPATSVRWESPQTWILPTLALGLGPLAIISRYTRAGVIDELSNDYVRTARAKGLHEYLILWRHVLRAALLPVITVAGPMFAAIVTGTFFVETIFGVPGMGKFFVTSVATKDHPMLMTLILIYGAFLALANLAVDLLYGVIDPRVRLADIADKKRGVAL
ncbi:MAG: ABC transporter permease [Oscillochloris sp.]|nr:ABC transporter permease [Oscillochloris sp.]